MPIFKETESYIVFLRRIDALESKCRLIYTPLNFFGRADMGDRPICPIIEQNASLPKEKRRYFYRDLIFDGKEKDYIIMEVPKTTLRKWNNQDNGHYRNLSFQKNYTFLSLDTLIQEGSSDLPMVLLTPALPPLAMSLTTRSFPPCPPSLPNPPTCPATPSWILCPRG